MSEITVPTGQDGRMTLRLTPRNELSLAVLVKTLTAVSRSLAATEREMTGKRTATTVFVIESLSYEGSELCLKLREERR